MSIRIGEQIISGGIPTNSTDSIVNQNEGGSIEYVYNWVGTTQEYEDQEVALLHPEWVCYITDDETHDEQEIEIVQYTARNVGDIFFTSRSDAWLNGAVPCDGHTYDLADYSGEESINALLQADKIPYVSISDYEAAITTKGWCDKFGWDGVEASTFKVPTLTAKIIQDNNIPVVGNGMTLGITDGTNNAGLASGVNTQYGGLAIAEDYGVSVGTPSTGQTWVGGDITMGITTDATKSGMIADLSNDSANLRVMVQLSTGFNDESVETLHSLNTTVTTLSSEVETIADSYVPNTYMTNCITKIPQDIKLELNNGTVTLKAGSKVYVPDGFEQDGTTRKYNKITIAQDLSVTLSTSGTAYIDQVFVSYIVDTNTIRVSHIYNSESGTGSIPTYTDNPHSLYYKLDTNYLYSILQDTTPNSSFPLAIVTRENYVSQDSVIKSIDQVFNGLGFIGSTLFTLPGIEGLAPNGRYSDGTPKSRKMTMDKVCITSSDTYSTTDLAIVVGEDIGCQFHSYYEQETNPNQNWTFWYQPSSNILQLRRAPGYEYEDYTVIEGFYIGKVDRNSGLFSNLRQEHVTQINNLHTEDRVVDFQCPTADNNYTWYRRYASGFIEQGGGGVTNGQTLSVTLPITMKNIYYNIQVSAAWDDAATGQNEGVKNKTVSGFDVTVSSPNIDVWWEVKGMVAY